MNYRDAIDWSRCRTGFLTEPAARVGSFNVVVRPAAAGTDLRVRASFSTAKWDRCESKGNFERWIQSRVKAAAEAKP